MVRGESGIYSSPKKEPAGNISFRLSRERHMKNKRRGILAFCAIIFISPVGDAISEVDVVVQAFPSGIEDQDTGAIFASASVKIPGISPLESSTNFSLATGIGHAFTRTHSASDSVTGYFQAHDVFTILGELPEPLTLVGFFDLNGYLRAFGGNCGGATSPAECSTNRTNIGGSLLIRDLADQTAYPINFAYSTIDPTITLPLFISHEIPFTVSSTHRAFSFDVHFNFGSQGDAQVDFGHTAAFTLPVPEGISLTSDSGVFLTQVPEPGVTAFFLAGLGLMGVVMRWSHMRRPTGLQLSLSERPL
jgi:hypothetical protein